MFRRCAGRLRPAKLALGQRGHGMNRAMAMAAAAMLGIAAVAQAAGGEGAAIDRMLADEALPAASEALTALTNARAAAAGRPVADRELDRLWGSYIFRSGEPWTASRYLDRALPAAATDAERVAILAMLAPSFERTGRFDRARAAYERLSTIDGGAAGDIARAGLARLALATDPVAARRLATVVRTDSASAEARFEAELVEAAAAGVLGADVERRAAVDRAWALAPTLPRATVAIERAAMAMANGGGGAQPVALLGVALSNADATGQFTMIAKRLPVCGESGLGPDDRLVATLWRPSGAPASVGVDIVRASRPEAIMPLLRALVDGATYETGTFETSVIPLELSCTKVVGKEYVDIVPFENDNAWYASRGPYPVVLRARDLKERIDEAAGRLTADEARFGATSIALVPAIQMLIDQYRATSDADDGRRALVLIRRLIAIERAAGVPTSIIALDTMGLELWRIWLGDVDPTAGFAAVARAFDAVTIDRTSAAFLADAARLGLVEAAPGTAEQRLALAEHVAARLRQGLPPTDRQLRSLDLAIANFRREALGTVASTWDGACTTADPPPKLIDGNVSEKDYPPVLLTAAIGGIVLTEFDVDKAGKGADYRTVLAIPPTIFNVTTTTKLKTFPYAAAQRRGAAVACRGVVQALRWQIRPD